MILIHSLSSREKQTDEVRRIMPSAEMSVGVHRLGYLREISILMKPCRLLIGPNGLCNCVMIHKEARHSTFTMPIVVKHKLASNILTKALLSQWSKVFLVFAEIGICMCHHDCTQLVSSDMVLHCHLHQ